MKKRTALWLLAAICALVLAALAPALWRQTAVADKGPIADRIVLRAVVIAAEGIADIAGPASGRVSRVLVRPGDKVTAGQLLAEVTGEAGKAADAVTRIESPIAGSVLARNADQGDSVAVAAQGGLAPLFQIADTSRTAVHAEIEERDAGRVQAGQEVRLTTPGGRRVIGTGVVERTAPRIDRRTIGADDARVRADGAVQSVWLRWKAETPEAPLGQRLEAEVTLAPKQAAVRVPRDAVVVRGGRTVVLTPALLLFSREVPVVVGAADGALAEVKGLQPGTRVFVD